MARLDGIYWSQWGALRAYGRSPEESAVALVLHLAALASRKGTSCRPISAC
jgi:hypothetical protein